MLLIGLVVLTLINNGCSVVPPGPPTNTTTSTSTFVPPTTSLPVLSREKVICKNFRSLKEKFVEHGDISCRVDDIPNSYGVVKKEYDEEDHHLLVRTTLLNLDLYRKYYHKKLISTHITKVNVLNFGQAQAFVDKVVIENDDNGGAVWVHVEVPPFEEVKLFVEIYGRRN